MSESDRKPYPSDVREDEWGFVAPYLTLLREDAEQREHSLREVFNGRRWTVLDRADRLPLADDAARPATVAHGLSAGPTVGAGRLLRGDRGRPAAAAARGRRMRTDSDGGHLRQPDAPIEPGELIFHVFGALAEFERDIIKERTQAGLLASRARGRVGGRPRALTAKQVAMARALYDDPDKSIKDICTTLRISKKTLYRYVEPGKRGVAVGNKNEG